MNKDVVYIEPEDDITDIISRIKSAKEKIVALVPPKKPGVMRSAVNIKLIAKTAKSVDKAVVIVSNDPGLVKIAAASGLPTAKTLNSRPVLPSEYREKEDEPEEIEEDEPEEDEDFDGDDYDEEESVVEKPAPKKNKSSNVKSKKVARPRKEVDEEIDDDDLDDEEEEEKPKKKESKKDLKKQGIKKLPNFDNYRKLIVIGGVAVVALIIFAVWAFGFAPAADIIVKMKTTGTNLSENVSLVTNQAAADNKSGKFLLEQISTEADNSVEFDGTGHTDAKEATAATGTVSVLTSLNSTSDSVSIPSGTTFTYNGKNYESTEAVSLSWSGSINDCDNSTGTISGVGDGCRKSATINVKAAGTGESFNIGATSGSGGWTTNISGNVTVFKSSAMTGGADATEAKDNVVTKDDIESAKNQLSDDADAKNKLLSKIEEMNKDENTAVITIDSSYKATADNPVSTPKEGESTNGNKAKLTARTTYTIYVVSKKSIDEYVTNYEAGKLGEDEKIYSTGTPFFERFIEGNKGVYSAKLKTTIKTGPVLSETDVRGKAQGEKVGEAKARVMDLSNSISDVEIKTSFPWVRSVPKDDSRVTVKFEVEGEDNK